MKLWTLKAGQRSRFILLSGFDVDPLDVHMPLTVRETLPRQLNTTCLAGVPVCGHNQRRTYRLSHK